MQSADCVPVKLYYAHFRSMSEQYRKEAEVHRRRADQAEAQNEPVKRRISELQAVVDSHPGQVQIVSQARLCQLCIQYGLLFAGLSVA